MSILNVNQIQPVGGGNTITVSASDISASGATITATSFVGPLTGAVTGNVTGNLTGNVTSSSTSTFSSGINVTGGRVLVGTTDAGSNGTADDLVVANNSSASDQAGISIRGGTSGRSQIFFSDGTSGQDEYRGMLRYDHSENSMQFRTDAAERLRITSDGKIGISDTSPENTLSIKNIGSFEGDANSFYLGSNFTGTGQNYTGSNKHAQRFFFNNAASNGYLKYENTGTTGTAGNAITWQERFRITSSGQFLLGSSTSAHSAYKLESYSGGAYNIMARSTNGNGGYHNFTGQSSNGTITSYISHNGRGYFEDGVKFDSSGEVLDTYEQGTFDPTISAVTSGSITLNSIYNTLSYTKIGRIVHISGQIRVSSVSSPVGNTLITNLPFTAQSTTEQGRAGSSCFYYDASAGSGNYYKTVSIHVTEGTTILNILTLHSLGGITVASGDELAFAFSYIAAS